MKYGPKDQKKTGVEKWREDQRGKERLGFSYSLCNDPKIPGVRWRARKFVCVVGEGKGGGETAFHHVFTPDSQPPSNPLIKENHLIHRQYVITSPDVCSYLELGSCAQLANTSTQIRDQGYPREKACFPIHMCYGQWTKLNFCYFLTWPITYSILLGPNPDSISFSEQTSTWK